MGQREALPSEDETGRNSHGSPKGGGAPLGRLTALVGVLEDGLRFLQDFLGALFVPLAGGLAGCEKHDQLLVRLGKCCRLVDGQEEGVIAGSQPRPFAELVPPTLGPVQPALDVLGCRKSLQVLSVRLGSHAGISPLFVDEPGR